jgi:hypothetical protein
MRHYWLVCGFLGLLLSGCGENPQPKARRGNPEGVGKKDAPDKGNRDDQNVKFDDAGGAVRIEGLTLMAPQGWLRQGPPRGAFVQAEYVLPRADGDRDDGRLTLSVAGTGKGYLEANIERWKGEFGGTPEKSHQEKIEAHGISVTLVDFSGVFEKPSPFSPGSDPNHRGKALPDNDPIKLSGHRMIAAVIPVGDQLHFVKAVGPEKTIETHAEKIKAFIRSARSESGRGTR